MTGIRSTPSVKRKGRPLGHGKEYEAYISQLARASCHLCTALQVRRSQRRAEVPAFITESLNATGYVAESETMKAIHIHEQRAVESVFRVNTPTGRYTNAAAVRLIQPSRRNTSVLPASSADIAPIPHTSQAAAYISQPCRRIKPNRTSA